VKHVVFAEKSLLMGDDAADLLLEYARLLGETSHVDTVSIRAIGSDGNTVDVGFLLNVSSVMVVESTNSTVEPPGNDEAVRYMQARIDYLTRPPSAPVDDAHDILHLDDFDTPGGK
jgi:hypothetical protein